MACREEGKDFAHEILYTINSTDEPAKENTVQNICKLRFVWFLSRKRVNLILLRIYQVAQGINYSLPS